MNGKIETVKVKRIKVPASYIQIEVLEHEFWKLLNRLQYTSRRIFESYDAYYLIPSHADIVYYAKKGEKDLGEGDHKPADSSSFVSLDIRLRVTGKKGRELAPYTIGGF